MLNHVNDASQSAGARNGSVTAASFEMSAWGGRGGISDQKVWAAKKRPEALKKQEEDLWSHRDCLQMRGSLTTAGWDVLSQRNAEAEAGLGAHCTP